jgi:hypothetical protein
LTQLVHPLEHPLHPRIALFGLAPPATVDLVANVEAHEVGMLHHAFGNLVQIEILHRLPFGR